MDNQTDISVNESKPKFHGCLIACLITFAALILHIAAIPFLIEIVDHIPRTKDTQTNGQYVVELQATSSPDWPFGSQDGRIVLKDNKNIHEFYTFKKMFWIHFLKLFYYDKCQACIRK